MTRPEKVSKYEDAFSGPAGPPIDNSTDAQASCTRLPQNRQLGILGSHEV